MHRSSIVLAAAALASLCSGRASACGTAVPSGPTAAGLNRVVCRDASALRLESVIFGAWVRNKPVLTTATGYSISGVPATTAMHFRAGIMQTEALTTILLQLVDEHKVSLDAPIVTWLPSLPHAKQVTLRMLANSTSGYGDYLADKSVQKTFEDNPFASFTPQKLIALAMKQPMAFRPGTGFHYAHTNLVVLGAALEKITGQSVAELIRTRIVAPLHLHDTQIPVGAQIQEPVQHAYSLDRGFYEESTYFDPSWATYSGTITSDIGDVATFQRALGRGALLSKAGFAAQLAPANAAYPPMTKNLYYGLGVLVENTWILQHARVSGYDVVMGYLPSRDLTIVVSTTLAPKNTLKSGGSAALFKDLAHFLAPERPLPPLFS